MLTFDVEIAAYASLVAEAIACALVRHELTVLEGTVLLSEQVVFDEWKLITCAMNPAEFGLKEK